MTRPGSGFAVVSLAVGVLLTASRPSLSQPAAAPPVPDQASAPTPAASAPISAAPPPSPGAPAVPTPGTAAATPPATGTPAPDATSTGTASAPASASPAPSASPSALPSPLTLSEALRLALALQPDLAASAAERQAAQERLRQANARFLPTVTPQFTYFNNYTFVNSNRFTTGTDGGQVQIPQSATQEARDGDVSLRYQLFDSGRRNLNARQARASLRSSTFGETDTRQLVIASVADSYFVTLQNQALVRVSEARVARAENTLAVIQAQVAAGAAARKDTLQAEADLALARVQLLQARNNADLAQAQLKNAIGVVGGGRLELSDVPAPAPDAPTTATLAAETGAGAGESAGAAGGTGGTSAAPAAAAAAATAPGGTAAAAGDSEINRFIDLAYRARPDVAQAAETIEINRAGVRLARIDAGVLVTSDAALGYQFSPDRGNNREISAQVSYPLFDGGLARAQVRENEAAVRGSEARVESLRQQVAVEVEQAWRDLAQARATLPAAEAAQRAAQVNYEAAIEARREGLGTIVDVITAQTQLAEAQSAFVQAVYGFYQGDARLARAVGQAERLLR